MLSDTEFNSAFAVFILRVITGILFFFQGYDKIFNVKINNVVRTFQDPISKSWIPNSLLSPFAWITALIELIAGVLLILGLFKNSVLMLLGLDLLLVAFAFSSIKAMWDMQFFFPRLVFILLLLLLPPEWDRWALDFLVK
ncbi:MAG: DoxX family protein [Bacteroidia bacterium]|nr:DoxX family protein [Bacteroidia bacterium]